MTKFIEITKNDGSVEYVAENFDELAAAAAANQVFVLNLTQEQLAQSEVSQKIYEHQTYLNNTDWYVSRKAETGKEVPNDILLNRQNARDYISNNK